MTDCREFQGPRDPSGYGRVNWGPPKYGRRRTWMGLHRWVMEQYIGRRLETHEVVRHSCDNPPCFLFEHLLLGTSADNSADAIERGRAVPPPSRGEWTECRRGHPLSGANLYIVPGSGYRYCRQCARERRARRRR